ncbi:MAG: phosphate signaling complex protein PhoU [Deltaproteobacteria bacterium]|nr:phosphate signaling complex protein PhoU [Deltaproteobacteria bacterium]
MSLEGSAKIHQRSFEKDLDEINRELTLLGEMVEKAISSAILSLKDRNSSLAKEVIRGDRVIDEQELKIDKLCIKYLALKQPKAQDLRFVTSVMKIINELERMGDCAESIARQAMFLATKPAWRPLINIPKMAEITEEMVRDCLDAFMKHDELLAQQVIKRDEEVDQLQGLIYKNLLQDMIQDVNNIERASSLLLVSSKLERIADQATNICEDVIYIVSGKIVRHKDKIQLEIPL